MMFVDVCSADEVADQSCSIQDNKAFTLTRMNLRRASLLSFLHNHDIDTVFTVTIDSKQFWISREGDDVCIDSWDAENLDVGEWLSTNVINNPGVNKRVVVITNVKRGNQYVLDDILNFRFNDTIGDARDASYDIQSSSQDTQSCSSILTISTNSHEVEEEMKLNALYGEVVHHLSLDQKRTLKQLTDSSINVDGLYDTTKVAFMPNNPRYHVSASDDNFKVIVNAAQMCNIAERPCVVMVMGAVSKAKEVTKNLQDLVDQHLEYWKRVHFRHVDGNEMSSDEFWRSLFGAIKNGRWCLVISCVDTGSLATFLERYDIKNVCLNLVESPGKIDNAVVNDIDELMRKEEVVTTLNAVCATRTSSTLLMLPYFKDAVDPPVQPAHAMASDMDIDVDIGHEPAQIVEEPFVNNGEERLFRLRKESFLNGVGVPDGRTSYERLVAHIHTREAYAYLFKAIRRWGVASMEVKGYNKAEIDKHGKLNLAYDVSSGVLTVDFVGTIVITEVVCNIIKEEWRSGDIVPRSHINRKIYEANWAIEWHFIRNARVVNGTKKDREIVFSGRMKTLDLVKLVKGSSPAAYLVL